jgi:CBS domain-containing protein
VTRSLRLARRTSVASAESLLAIEPLLIPAGEDLLAAMRTAAAHPSTRVIGIVDDVGRVVGVLPASELAEAVVAHAVPEVFFAASGDIEGIGRFARLLEAHTIGEIAQPPAVITAERTIGDAFREMHRRKLSGLYVVDDDGRPSGYLDLQELAMRYVEALEAEQGTRHARVADVQDPPTRGGA